MWFFSIMLFGSEPSWWVLYSTANDPQPQMIRRLQMIPKLKNGTQVCICLRSKILLLICLFVIVIILTWWSANLSPSHSCRDHLRSTLGITCGRGSFAFGDHLCYCTVLLFMGQTLAIKYVKLKNKYIKIP